MNIKKHHLQDLNAMRIGITSPSTAVGRLAHAETDQLTYLASVFRSLGTWWTGRANMVPLHAGTAGGHFYTLVCLHGEKLQVRLLIKT